MIRILLVDDHLLFAEGLATLLQQANSSTITSSCKDASQILTAVENFKPDIILLDINLGELNGISVCRTLLYHYPSLRIIALSMYHELRYVRGMKEAGAQGYLLKNVEYSQVMEAIETVYAGNTYFNDLLKAQPTSSHLTSSLNPKEKRILNGVLGGKTSRKIAEDLGISLKTVEFYRNSLFVKFDVKNVVELINKARNYGYE